MIVALRYNVAPTESPGTLPFVIPLLLWNNKGSVPPARDQQLFLLGASLSLSLSVSLSLFLCFLLSLLSVSLSLPISLCCFCLSCSLSLTFCSCGFLARPHCLSSLIFLILFVSLSECLSLSHPMSLPSLSVALVLWVSQFAYVCFCLFLSFCIPVSSYSPG